MRLVLGLLVYLVVVVWLLAEIRATRRERARAKAEAEMFRVAAETCRVAAAELRRLWGFRR